MTAEQLQKLETQLWAAADQLRANSRLTATEYSFPVLGLIFLRHAFNRYKTAEIEITQSLPVHPQRGRRAVTKDDFLQAKAIFLPEKAQWPTIANRPEGEDIGQVIDEAMRMIEDEYEVLEGVLPRNYSIFEKQLLHRLVRIFNNEALNNVSGDVFGRIYEYFLNKFAMTGAQEGGEFFTPPSLVNTIVQVIEPDHGIVFDPACGSAGMFVQTGHFIESEGLDPSSRVTFYGQEKADTNTKLAKMNMTVHGLDASILQGNTFYENQHDVIGRCDFVMANPPFNVDGVDKEREYVRNDPRLPFGLPRNDNANYLWIQYFYSYLNDNGRAGFVMASSASDAGHSEKDIRESLVNTGSVDVMISIGPKFFYTRSLPCTLWFFDRGKEKNKKRNDQTLMLDLREVYRKVSSNLHDFTAEHLRNIHTIVRMYRGDKDIWQETIAVYEAHLSEAMKSALAQWKELKKVKGLLPELNSLRAEELKTQKRIIHHGVKSRIDGLKEEVRGVERAQQRELKEEIARLEALMDQLDADIDIVLHFQKEIHWLQSRFPKGKYMDVPGLCKVVSREEIAANDFSLTPGRYVGVAQHVDDDFDFEVRMAEIKVELLGLNEESIFLAQKIQDDLNELGI